MDATGYGWDPGRLKRAGRLAALARLVRIEHTLFSLPYAYAGAFVACSSCIDLRVIVLASLALVGLRTAAMAFNNIADLDIDRLNPRTRMRPLVVGAVSVRDAWGLVVLGSLLYYTSAAMLNTYALMLSPLVWLIAMSYPYAKRLHWLPHLHLGLVLGLAVVGGAVASIGAQASSLAEVAKHIPWLLVAAVTFWVAGFDTYYSIMDYEFDKSMGLGSIPARLGVGNALRASLVMHVASIIMLVASLVAYRLGFIAAAAFTVTSVIIFYQHLLLARRGLEAIPEAFNTNLVAGLVMGLGIVVDRIVF